VDPSQLREHIAALFAEKLSIDPPGPDLDLVDEGLLDSLMFVELVFALEKTFGVRVPLEEVEVKDLASVGKIADFVAARLGNPGSGDPP
jgi:D-alanine--poly(phosphoribitol) ligase subunit 2